VAIPTITKDFVTDIPNCYMVADPFLTKVGSTHYLFFEAQYDDGITLNVGAGNYCCYATSPDGLTWTYGSKIETLPGGNYCQVMQLDVDGQWTDYYVAPHLSQSYMDLYKAVTFPAVWTLHRRMITVAYQLRDATVFYYGGYWWVVAGTTDPERLMLFYSDDLLYGTFTAHPSNPILTGIDKSRPGGRPIVRAGSVDLYLQDSATTYGNKLRAYRLTNLTTATVTVTELGTSPILEASGVADAWNKDGMHQLDRINSGLSVVDGKILVGGEDVWAIGFYRDTTE
jgi:hypothetical protein